MLGYKSTKRFDRVYTSPLFFYSEQDYIKKKHGRIRAFRYNSPDELSSKICQPCINKVENHATCYAKEHANDGQAFFSIFEEQANECQQEAKSAKNQADDVKDRHPANNQANQGQNKTGDAESILSFDDLIHYIIPNSCRAQLLVSVDCFNRAKINQILIFPTFLTFFL